MAEDSRSGGAWLLRRRSLWCSEFLNALAGDFGDVHGTVLGNGEHVRELKIAGFRSGGAPGSEHLAVERHLDDFVGPAVSDEHALIGRDEQAKRRDARDLANEPAFGVEDLDAVVLTVGNK